MRSIFQPDFKFAGKLTILLAFSFFAAGCHTDNEPAPVSKTTVKKDTAGQASESSLRNFVKAKTLAETTQNYEQKRPVSFTHDKHTNNDAVVQRDPFTNPTSTNQTITNCNNPQTMQQAVPKVTTVQPAVPPYSPEPSVVGIFNNGKEKFALVRWQQVKGVFRCGENLGNGYYVKEISANIVLLCPNQNRDGADSIKLTLR